MKKAFLCHSSSDKVYVQTVARRLGRAKVIFDEFSFRPGQDFRDEIVRNLHQSNFFVFFVSKASLASTWCRFEIDEAMLLKMSGGLEGQLAIIIDPTVNFEELPRWLQRMRAIIQTRPNQATRDIQYAVLSVSPYLKTKAFVGRENLQRRFEESISALDIEKKKIIIVSGLDGVGRRSYLERVCRDALGLTLGPYVLIDETRGLEDLYLWALDETGELSTREQLATELATFRELPEAEKISQIYNRLKILSSGRTIPCLVDSGGMLDNLGAYKPPYASLIGDFVSNDSDQYLCIVHRRSPWIRELEGREAILVQEVGPLERHETTLLFQQLLRRSGIPASSTQISEVVSFLEGYPPAVYFAAESAEKYGMSNLVADKSALVDFRARKFSRFVADLTLSDPEWLVLRYLASEQAMPLEAIAVVANEKTEDVAVMLRHLIDLSVVILLDDAYSISPPIRDAIHRVRGFLDAEFYAKTAEQLAAAFWNQEDVAPSIEVVDATLNASARGGAVDFSPYQDLIRVSGVQKMAQESYYRKEWDKAVEYAKRAEQMDSSREIVRAIHFKGLVQLGEWDLAERKLEQIYSRGDRFANYLKGFMLRKRRLFTQAIAAFKKAYESGDRSYPLHRDWADCLFRIGEYELALDKISWVLERDPENIFVLDLFIRISIELDMFQEAEKILEKLERYDVDQKFIHHRKARFLSAKRLWDPALVEADAACSSGYSPFEAFAHRVDVLIELRRYPEAMEAINDLERRFRSHRRDVQLGLRCKCLVRQDRWQEAQGILERIEDKTSAVHLRLMQRILLSKSQDDSVPHAERQAALREANFLRDAEGESYPYMDVEDELDPIDERSV